MPKRTYSKVASPAATKKKPKVPTKKRKVVANGHKLPEPLPDGEILTDVKGEKWRLGKSIGVGGFGEIYLASDDIKKPTTSDAKYVVKIEPHSNGPLFTEMHFYHRVGKSEEIIGWMKQKKLKFLGMPSLIGSGSHDYKGVKYRFMVIQRFGDDLQKLLDKNGRVFPLKTVYTLGLKVLDVLEYIHSHGYIHADVKASNLMSGFGKDKQNDVYLIDFGLSCRYTSQGVHKEYKEDLRKAHDGTIEFTSRDAHIGAHSRRGDLEILGYNMLQWLCGRLPWEDNLKDPNYVSKQKVLYMKNIPSLMSECFQSSPPPQGIADYFKYVTSLKFEEEPDYELCRKILKSALKFHGFKDDGKLIFASTRSSSSPGTSKKATNKKTSGQLNKGRKITSRKVTSENTPRSPSPVKKLIRKASSAKPGLQSTSPVAALPESESPSKVYAMGFDNPTPAMMLIIKRKVEQMKQPEPTRGRTVSKAKSKEKNDKNMKENKPLRLPWETPDDEDDDDILKLVENKHVVKTSPKKLPSPKTKAAPKASYKTKKRSPVTSRIKLKSQTNSFSL